MNDDELSRLGENWLTKNYGISKCVCTTDNLITV